MLFLSDNPIKLILIRLIHYYKKGTSRKLITHVKSFREGTNTVFVTGVAEAISQGGLFTMGTRCEMWLFHKGYPSWTLVILIMTHLLKNNLEI